MCLAVIQDIVQSEAFVIEEHKTVCCLANTRRIITKLLLVANLLTTRQKDYGSKRAALQLLSAAVVTN